MADAKAVFRFKQFSISQEYGVMKVGTDGVLLGAWVATETAKNALDIGCGTGLIGIMLGQRAPSMRIDAVEIDSAAAGEAKENAAAAPWSDRLEVFETSIQEFARTTDRRYDLIVSNPPFFTGGVHNASDDRTAVRHTVKLPHGDLLRAVQTLLLPQGRFAVILPLIEGLRFAEMAQRYQLYPRKKCEIRPRLDKSTNRLLLEFGREQGSLETTELVLYQDEQSTRTDAHWALVADFYL